MAKPTYLIEFPDAEFKKQLKMACAMKDLNIKDFILQAISEKINNTMEVQ